MTSDHAARQLDRIVLLVAELSRREREGSDTFSVKEIAERLGVTPSRVLSDIRVLTSVNDDADATWISSLTAFQEGDRISVSSLGPYRRPIRFTGDELLALQVALATEGNVPTAILRDLAEISLETGDEHVPRAISPVPFVPDGEAAVVHVARGAMNAAQALEIAYAGEGADRPSDRVVHPHDVVAARGKHYVIAWCTKASDWRRFRADRILEITQLDQPFTPRSDAPSIDSAKDLFEAPAEHVDDVTVRFAPAIARWVRERYPSATSRDDGSVVVTFTAASADWLVRTVLQYGAEAEVVGPPAYREMVRRAVGGSS